MALHSSDKKECRLCGDTYDLDNYGFDKDPQLCIPCMQWLDRGMKERDMTVECVVCETTFNPENEGTIAIHYHHWNKGKERLPVCSQSCKQRYERTGF